MPELGPLDLFVFPASFAQARLWFVSALSGGGASYHIPVGMRLRGALDHAALQSAIDRVVGRQEALRTTFAVEDGEVVQVVHPAMRVLLELQDFSALDDAARQAEAALGIVANRTFDLAAGPLIRCALFRVSAEEHLFVVVLHHIVADGWSVGVLLRELAEGYSAAVQHRDAEVPDLPVQYADYALWQRDQLSGDSLAELEGYWRERLQGPLPLLELPTRANRTVGGTTRPAGRWRFRIDASLAGRIATLARAERATDFMAYLAAFQLLLARYAASSDVIVGTPMSGRGSSELEPLVGLFVNTLAIRTDLAGNPSIRELLTRVRESALGAFAHDALPFERLVDVVKPARDRSRTPIFQAVFSMQGAEASGDGGAPDQETFAGLQVERVSTSLDEAKFDLQLTLTPDGQGVLGSLQYDAELLDAAVIQRLGRHYLTLLEAMTANPDAPADAVRLMDAAEEQQLLSSWNATATPYPRDATVHELFTQQAEAHPDAIAVMTTDGVVTYGALASEAAILADRLRAQGVAPGQLVGLCAERSVDMLVAMLAILEVGAAYLPLDPQYPAERLSWMLQDVTAPVLLVQAGTIAVVERGLAAVAGRDDRAGIEGAPPRFVLIEERRSATPGGSVPRGDLPPRVGAESPAYVMYTSGSTGKPKGVVVPHRAIVRLVRDTRYVHLGPDETMLAFAPASFDAATFEVWGALLNGGRLVLAPTGPPDLPALGALIERFGVTTLWLTSALFQEFVDVGLGYLGRVRQLLAGGDVLSVPHVRRVLATLPACRVINGYGPTENTTFTCCYEVPRDWPTDRAIPIGRPIANSRAYVLDAAGRPVPIGVAGELYAGGDGVALGYLRDPDLTAARFLVDPFAATPGARMYRTGDRVRWREDGVLEFLGRMDAQLKIRGFRVEPGEIEAVLLSHPAVRAAAVIPVTAGGSEKQLAGYCAPHDGATLTVADLRAFLRERLPAYMVPAYLELLPSLPVSPTGKVDRAALPAPTTLASSAEFEEPATDTERVVAEVFAQTLRVERVGASDDFFELGGHSLLAIRIAARLQERLGLGVAIRLVFEHPGVRSLAAMLDGGRLATPAAEGPTVVARRAHGEEQLAPASFAQVRLWFIEQAAPDRSTYNIGTARRLRGVMDVDLLQAAVDWVVARQESLRTRFELVDGELMQVIAPAGRVPVQLHQAASPAEAEAIVVAQSNRPFDLRQGPLVRVDLVREGPEEQRLLVTLHHIVADGWSVSVLWREIATAYSALREGRPLAAPPLAIQYADYASWQRERLQGELLERYEQYWREQLQGPLPTLDLPTRQPRPAILGDRPAGRRAFRIPAALAHQIDHLARSERATPFMVGLAAFQLLLSRHAAQEDVIVGSPMAGRESSTLEPLIGLFLNTIALRTDLSGSPTVRELLGRVREVTLGAYAHQALPFERVVDLARPERHPAMTPIFQVMFSMENATTTAAADGPPVAHAFAGLEGHATGTGLEFAKFDLQFTMAPDPEGYRGSIVFDAQLFDEEMVERMAAHFVQLLHGMVAAPDQPVTRVSMLHPSERQQLLTAGNGAMPVPGEGTDLSARFVAQCGRTPDAPALSFGSRTLTYAELDRQVTDLAAVLRAAGVGHDVLVGVCLPRSLELVIAVLGILRAGGCYLPLDPDYPADRLAFIVEDSDLLLVLSQAGAHEVLPQGRVPLLLFGQSPDGVVMPAPTAPRPTARDADSATAPLAYVIYTSGSTGQPKGVEVEQRSVANFLDGLSDGIALRRGDVLVAVTPLSFDISVLELLHPLTSGAEVVVAPVEVSTDPRALAALLDRVQATHMQATPSTWRMLVEHGWAGRPGMLALCGGEALSQPLADALVSRGMVLWNLYGPTEATIWATWQQQEQVGQAVRIGRPMPGVRAYILDGLGEPVPIGVPGELLLGGKCLARGYHKRPTLTAERFIADPFVEEAGARMYRTGDRARWHRDGTIEYLGRTDFQVKLRGHRIELGEIEAALVRQPGVAAAAVLVREDAPGDQRLVGYVVPATGAAPEEAALRAALRDILPAIMVPTAIVTLDKFPQTPNGKLDRKALPAPSGAGRGIVDAFVLPRTPMEEELAALWSRVLGLGQVGVEDDFFDLGGNSLLALRMMAEVERAWGQRLSFRRFFERPTVATLAEVLVAAVTEAEEAGVPVLQPDGGGTPLFFVHGDILAHGWYCRRLAPLLGTAPLVVLPTCGPDTPGQPLTIEAMARFHLETLRRQQPSGPYRLAGYCHGGLVAYEMARQLVALGERVEHLVLIDGFAMNLKQRYLEPLVRLLTAPPTSVEAVTRLALVRYHFFYLGLRWPKLRQGGVVSILRAGIRFVARRAGLYRGATAEQASVPSDELAPGLGIVGAFVQRAQRAYMPGPYSGRVDLIWASGVSRARWPNGSCGWDQVAAEVHVHVTEGSHTSIVLPEGLPGLAERLREVLTGPGLA